MKLSTNARAIYNDMTMVYTRCLKRIKQEEFFKAGVDAYLITGYKEAIFNAKRSGTINNHDTTHLLKILKYYLEDVYLNIKGIEVKLDA